MVSSFFLFLRKAKNLNNVDYQPSTKGIKSWAEDDRPREKLLLKGKAALSDAELIAILLGSGSRDETAVDLAKRILKSVKGNLNELGRLGVPQLTKFKGVGAAKALSIITALEIGKRRRMSEALQRKNITSSALAFELLQPLIGDLPYEEFWVVYLSSSNKLLATRCMSKGGITGTLADVRMIFKEALHLNATAMILAHNHPSGELKPSMPDKSLTSKLIKAGDMMDVKVMDHLIVTEHQYFSFADEGIM